jgi:hypothetical protein
MFLKEGTSLAGAGYRVSVVVPHPHDEVISGITIKAAKFASRSPVAGGSGGTTG